MCKMLNSRIDEDTNGSDFPLAGNNAHRVRPSFQKR